MLMLPENTKVWISSKPADMRKSFLGLSMIVQEVLEQNPTSGNLFVFLNKSSDRIKVLYWDRNGFAFWYKQLVEGKFRFPKLLANAYSITLHELCLLLEGIDLTHKNRFASVEETLIN